MFDLIMGIFLLFDNLCVGSLLRLANNELRVEWVTNRESHSKATNIHQHISFTKLDGKSHVKHVTPPCHLRNIGCSIHLM